MCSATNSRHHVQDAPGTWLRHVDEKSGVPFYHNKDARTSQYAPPPSCAWSKGYRDGKPVYTNAVTRQRVWMAPKALAWKFLRSKTEDKCAAGAATMRAPCCATALDTHFDDLCCARRKEVNARDLAGGTQRSRNESWQVTRTPCAQVLLVQLRNRLLHARDARGAAGRPGGGAAVRLGLVLREQREQGDELGGPGRRRVAAGGERGARAEVLVQSQGACALPCACICARPAMRLHLRAPCRAHASAHGGVALWALPQVVLLPLLTHGPLQ